MVRERLVRILKRKSSRGKVPESSNQTSDTGFPGIKFMHRFAMFEARRTRDSAVMATSGPNVSGSGSSMKECADTDGNRFGAEVYEGGSNEIRGRRGTREFECEGVRASGLRRLQLQLSGHVWLTGFSQYM